MLKRYETECKYRLPSRPTNYILTAQVRTNLNYASIWLKTLRFKLAKRCIKFLTIFMKKYILLYFWNVFFSKTKNPTKQKNLTRLKKVTTALRFSFLNYLNYLNISRSFNSSKHNISDLKFLTNEDGALQLTTPIYLKIYQIWENNLWTVYNMLWHIFFPIILSLFLIIDALIVCLNAYILVLKDHCKL